MRFVIDDGAFSDWDGSDIDLEESLWLFVDLLKYFRDQGEIVGLLDGWGQLNVTEQDDLATVLTTRRNMVDRDTSNLLLGLLGKCAIWDADPSVAVSDDDLLVDGRPYKSLGVAYAVTAAAAPKGVGVATMAHVGFQGMLTATCNGMVEDLSFIVRSSDCAFFYRSLYALEDINEKYFFTLAVKAFPELRFAENLSFSKFVGGYAWRDTVVSHLSALNDDFLEAYISEHGNSARISTRIGISVSIEGETRSSERLMAFRDAGFDGRVFRCEWHSKLEPHRNRIHFYPGDVSTDSKILIGIFVDHLPT